MSLLLIAALVLPIPRQAAASATALQRLVLASGEPDDLAVDAQGRLIWGDLRRGAIERFDGRRITTIASGLSAPEGVVPLPDGALAVAEQGKDRIDRVGRDGRITVLYRLVPVAGVDGVDGITRDPRGGDLIVPDAARGRVLRLSVDGRRARVIATGLGRPAGAAVDGRGIIWVADETNGAVFTVTPQGVATRAATLPEPDDVAIDRAGRVWVTTLGDGALWVIDKGKAARRVLAGLSDPQGLALDRCDNPIVVQSATGRIDRLVTSASPTHCLF